MGIRTCVCDYRGCKAGSWVTRLSDAYFLCEEHSKDEYTSKLPNWRRVLNGEISEDGSDWGFSMGWAMMDWSRECITLKQHLDGWLAGWYTLEFGGIGSGGTLAYSKDRAEFEACLKDDKAIERLFDQAYPQPPDELVPPWPKPEWCPTCGQQKPRQSDKIPFL